MAGFVLFRGAVPQARVRQAILSSMKERVLATLFRDSVYFLLDTDLLSHVLCTSSYYQFDP